MKLIFLFCVALGLCSCGESGRVAALESRVKELEGRLEKHQAALLVQGEINDLDRARFVALDGKRREERAAFEYLTHLLDEQGRIVWHFPK